MNKKVLIEIPSLRLIFLRLPAETKADSGSLFEPVGALLLADVID